MSDSNRMKCISDTQYLKRKRDLEVKEEDVFKKKKYSSSESEDSDDSSSSSSSLSSSSSSQSCSDSSSSSSESSNKKKKKTKKKKQKLSKKEKKRRKKQKLKEKKLKKKLKKKGKKVKAKLVIQEEDEGPVGPVPLPGAQEVPDRSKRMAPMTKEEWEKKQSVVRRVFDEATGRHRLIKGDGEVLEELVSKQRHQEINRQATLGDGTSFQNELALKLGQGNKK